MSKTTFPFDDLLRIVKNNARATEKMHREECWQAFKLTGHHARALFDYWFDHNYRRISIDHNANGPVVTPVRGASPPNAGKAQAAGQRAANRARVTRLANAVSQVVLMDLRTSTGKKIRDCTFGELKKEAGWLGAIAKLGKPTEIVGKKLAETDLFNIRMRNAA